MRVLQIGNVGIRQRDGAASAPFSTENDLRKSLESMGHTVHPVHEDGWGGDPSILDTVKPDLVLWTKTPGWGPSPHMTLEFFAGAKARGIPTAGLHLDLWKGLERANAIAAEPYFHGLDVFAQADPDLEWWRARGVNAIYSPPGVLEASCYLADPVPELAHEIVFVGSRGYHPEYPFRGELIVWLERTYGPRFKLYEHGSGMREHRLNQLYASARVVVGDSCFAGKIPGYWSDRLPESLGRGARLVFPRIQGRLAGWSWVPCAMFEPGDFSDLQAKIEARLAVPEAEALTERLEAIEWTKATSTYRIRLQALLDALAGRGLLKVSA